ncbi:MAG: hypothetical protein NUW37_17285 [Planctomycetes bacterium]|nr:hypothetical protein [Planctomycetota bacterium]
MAEGCPPCEEGAPAWMLTYGDMVTLVLTFFILLFAMSDVNRYKFAEVLGSIQDAFGQGYNVPTIDVPQRTEDFFKQIIQRSQLRIPGQNVNGPSSGDATRINAVREGLSIAISDEALFDEYSCLLNERSFVRLRNLATQYLLGYRNRIILQGAVDTHERDPEEYKSRNSAGRFKLMVAGETQGTYREVRLDNVIDGRDLSYYRARAVYEFLIGDAAIIAANDNKPIDKRRFELRAMDLYDEPGTIYPGGREDSESNARTSRTRRRVEIIVSTVLLPSLGSSVE